MELKVWTEDGVARVVSGVNEVTTCRDVMVAVAQVTGGVGRYCMSVCWGDVCRRLSPTDRPIEVLNNLDELHQEARFFVNSSSRSSQKKTKLKMMEANPGIENNKRQLESRFSKTESTNQAQVFGGPNAIPNQQAIKSHKRGLQTSNTEQHLQEEYPSNKSPMRNKLPVPRKTQDSSGSMEFDESFPERFAITDDFKFSQQNYLQNFNKDMTEAILIEKHKHSKLQERLSQIKFEIEEEETSENIEMQKIENLLRNLEELQAKDDKLNDQLEELQLVSWEDKLQLETSKEKKLEMETKQANDDLELILTKMVMLDDKIEKLKGDILIEEDLRNAQELESIHLKNELQVKIDKRKLFEDKIDKLDTHISTLEENLKQSEEDIALKLERLRTLEGHENV